MCPKHIEEFMDNSSLLDTKDTASRSNSILYLKNTPYQFAILDLMRVTLVRVVIYL